jgi:hypothetical protein
MSHATFESDSVARVALTLAISALLAAPVWAQPTKLPAACSKRFIEQWSKDRDAANRSLPKTPCTMQGDTGIYVCNQNGCQRPW